MPSAMLQRDLEAIQTAPIRAAARRGAGREEVRRAPSMPLRQFIGEAWPSIQPHEFVPGWHIDAIAEHLEAVTRGEIRNLLINIPPRCMKSLTVSVFWPTWVWSWNPEKSWLYSSYAAGLATRDSVRCRRLIESRWYREHFGSVFRLADDQNMKTRFENDHGGYRIASGVGGSQTGEGADVLVADDPHKVKEAESDTVREGVILWWDETMSSRLNDPRTGAKVIVMQRVHEADLAGHVLEAGGYEHLCIPQEYDPPETRKPPESRTFTSIGWTDPRTEEDELLWPERFGPEEVAKAKQDLGTYAYAGQHEQRPAPRKDGMLHPSEWPEWTVLPGTCQFVQAWDPAISEKQSADMSAGACIGVDADQNIYIVDGRDGRWGIDKLEDEIIEFGGQWHPVQVGIEAVAYQVAIVQQMLRKTMLPIRPLQTSGGRSGNVGSEAGLQRIMNPNLATLGGDKVSRARLLEARASVGKVFRPATAGPWWTEMRRQLELFPNGKHDDYVDALSYCVHMAATISNRWSDDYAMPADNWAARV